MEVFFNTLFTLRRTNIIYVELIDIVVIGINKSILIELVTYM